MATTLPVSGDVLSDEPFLLVNPQVGTRREGAPYLRCLLRNAGGQVAGRCWAFDAGRISSLEQARAVRVDGQVVDYQGRPQVNIESIEPFDADVSVMTSLMPRTTGDVATMFRDVRSLLETLRPSLRGLAEAFLDDVRFAEDFCAAPAAVRMHHACIGGLLEHTLSVMRVADSMAGAYAGSAVEVDRDLCVMGAFLHDIGKTVELSWTDGFAYTNDGNLIGHIVRGAMMIDEKAAEAQYGDDPPSPEDVRALQHIVLSHHERPEYGAARKPATPEAHIVAMADRVDATLHLTEE